MASANHQSVAGYTSMAGAVSTGHQIASGGLGHIGHAIEYAFSFDGLVKGIAMNVLDFAVPRIEAAIIPSVGAGLGGVISFAVGAFNKALQVGIITSGKG